MPIARLVRDSSVLIVVDMQQRLLPAMHNTQAVTDQVGKLINGANALQVPVIVTEQYRKGLGLTVPELAESLKSAAGTYEKLAFSAFIEPVRRQIVELGARSVVVGGIEAHVCVLQTCLDVVDSGLTVAVATDGIGARRLSDQASAVQRMVQAGVVPTTVESILLEWVGEAGGPSFKSILPIIR